MTPEERAKKQAEVMLAYANGAEAKEREACAKICEDDGYEVGAALANDIRMRANA